MSFREEAHSNVKRLLQIESSKLVMDVIGHLYDEKIFMVHCALWKSLMHSLSTPMRILAIS